MTHDRLEKSLADIAAAARPPVPWRDGNKIPWDDPEFSVRMLAVHLDQSTNMASRTRPIIARHVRWLWERLHAGDGEDGGSGGDASRDVPPGGHPPDRRLRILDLGCGPGLYCHELARLGAEAIGCDFAPEPLAYAERTAKREGLACRFLRADLVDPPADLARKVGPCDAVTFWFGEFNSFPPDRARGILRLAAGCLRPGGLLFLEYQPWDSFPHDDTQEWTACDRSVFSDRPHLWLQESYWNDEVEAEITVHWIVDAGTGKYRRYAQCHQAYRDADLIRLCEAEGLVDPVFYPPVTGLDERLEFPVLVARREGT